MDGTVEKVNKAYDGIVNAHEELLDIWYHEILFGFQWWIEVFLITVPWIIWIIVRKKESTDRLLYAGFFVMLISSYMDMIGVAYGVWSYPTMIVPLMPAFIPWDICLFPVATMLFLQYKPEVSPILKAIFFSALGSFGFEPVAEWLTLYDPKDWQHYYSFPIIAMIYLMAHYVAYRDKFEKL